MPFGVAEQLAVAVIGGQRVAAVLDEAEHVVEVAPRAARRRARRAVTSAKRASGWKGAAQAISRRCWARTSSPPGRGGSPSCSPCGDGLDRAASHSSTSKRFAGTRMALRGLVHAVVGAADALQQAGDALGRADLDHLVDAAPVDAEVERGGGDHGAQLPGAIAASTRRRCAMSRLPWCRAIGRSSVVQPPERLEEQLAPGRGC